MVSRIVILGGAKATEGSVIGRFRIREGSRDSAFFTSVSVTKMDRKRKGRKGWWMEGQETLHTFKWQVPAKILRAQSEQGRPKVRGYGERGESEKKACWVCDVD